MNDSLSDVIEVDNEKLKQAILECARAEVVRALNGILCPGSSVDSEKSKEGASHSSLVSDGHKHRRRALDATASGESSLNCPMPKTSLRSKSQNEKHHPSPSLSLESVDTPCCHTQIDRSSINFLKRSSAIIAKTTGEPPKTFNAAKRDTEATPLSKNTLGSERDDNGVIGCESDGAESSLRQAVLWSDNFRPTTTRLIHTANSVLRNKPPRRRPLTTTALERRKPPPSTAASQRSKAQEVSKRLLGPITLESKQQNCDVVIPNSLACNEWENELARNIINVFSNKVRSEIKRDPLLSDADQASPPMIATNSFFSDNSVFHRKYLVQEEGGDFEQISISREATNDNTEVEVSKTPNRESIRSVKRCGKGDIKNGTFQLKMIWFTGTGTIQANWESINEVDSRNSIDCEELSMLEEQGRYMRYTSVVESSIASWNSRTLHHKEHSNLKQQLWRQLIITCNYFATRLIQKRKYSKAMEMIERAFGLIGSELGLLKEHSSDELTAMIKDTYAYYYIRRSKPSVSYQYLISAINIYKRQNDALNVAKCRLHQSFIQCAQHKYSNSMESLQKVLTMVEIGALDVEIDSNQVLLVTSVAYHNIAVQQLMLGFTTDSCVSSQNARRLARLCLSVSSHYLPMLEVTHKQSLNELCNMLKNCHNEKQASLFRNLISELFDQ